MVGERKRTTYYVDIGKEVSVWSEYCVQVVCGMGNVG